MPSAFQARIGGAKGLWIVDYHNAYSGHSPRDFWIEISDSQLKVQPHPKDHVNADEYQRTFEVVKFSQPCKSAKLNIQLITILADRGVPRSSLQKLLQNELDEYHNELTDSLQHPAHLLAFLQKWHGSRSKKFDVEFTGSMPDSKEDELNLLLEAGFHPQESKRVEECLRPIVKYSLQDRYEKLRIGVPFSTNLFLI